MSLKIESLYLRNPDIDKQKPPKEPLSNEEKEYLTKKYIDEFCKEYEYFSHKMKCLNPLEASNKNKEVDSNGDYILNLDVRQDGAIFFITSCLTSFDKEKFKGKIQDTHTEGKNEGKTLDFFFMNYCRTLLRYHLLDTNKKKAKLKKYEEFMGEKIEDETILEASEDVEEFYEPVSDLYGGHDIDFNDLFDTSKQFLNRELNELASAVRNDKIFAKFIVLKKIKELTVKQIGFEIGEQNAKRLNKKLTRMADRISKIA